MTGPPQGQPLPPEYGPPPYEATLQPGFVPPHVPGEGPMPKPLHMPMHMPHPHSECAYLTESISISERRATTKLKSKSVVMQQVSSNRSFSCSQ